MIATAQSLTDEQLAIAAQRGSLESFELLVRRLQSPLLRFLSRRVKCLTDAEDIAQEAFVRAYRQLDRYRDQWRFRTWLFTIGHRLAINAGRRQRPEASEAAQAAVSMAPGAADVVAAAEERDNLWRIARDTLDEEQVSALWLHYVEQLSTAEVAQVLSRSRVGVKTMLFRARKKLLPLLASLEALEGRPSPPTPLPAAGRGETHNYKEDRLESAGAPSEARLRVAHV